MPDEVEGSSVTPSEPTPAPSKDVVHVRMSKKTIWSIVIMVLVLGLGLATWFFQWPQKALNFYNRGSVSLKIREDDKFLIEGATVTVDGQAYTTDANGKVAIATIVAGSYPLKVHKDGYTDLDSTLSVVRGENEIQYFSLTKAPVATYTVSGLVSNAVSRAPMVNVQVKLGKKTAASNPAGEFSFSGLSAGEYKLILSNADFNEVAQTVTVATTDLAVPEIRMVPSGQVVFVSNRDGKRSLYLANYAGEGQKQLVAPAGGGEDFGAILSPDGKKVVFSSTRDGIKSNLGETQARLYLVGTDGKGLTKISDDLAPNQLEWSPSGKYLYFSGYSDVSLSVTTHRVYNLEKGTTFDLGDTAPSNVTFNNASDLVAYVTYDSAVYKLKTVDVATGSRSELVSKNGAFDNISFSADDANISYFATQDASRSYYTYKIAAKAEAGVAGPILTNNRSYVSSPTKKASVFIEARDGKYDLFQVDVDGKNEKKLTKSGVVSEALQPRFDATGSYVIYAIRKEAETALYIVSTAGGESQKITDFLYDQNGPAYGY